MRFFAILTIILLISTKSFAQKKDSLLNLDDLSNLTVLLYQPVTNESGSGLIIIHNSKYYLLTANHVANQMSTSAKIIFRTSNDKPGILDLTSLTKDHKLNWINHQVADLSLLELTPFNDNIKSRFDQSSFSSKFIYSGQEISFRDNDITFLGFPVLDLELEHFSPLTFTSHLASGLITQKRLDNGNKCNFFYLDIPGMQGCSGSGVFLSVKKAMYMGGNTTILVGIVHGTQGDSSGGKLAIITPSYYIWDMLNSL